MRRHLQRMPTRMATLYVALCAAIAAAAQVWHDPRWYVAVLLLTLPFGLVAVAGVYLAYGLVGQLVAAASPGITGDQLSARTLVLVAPVDVALFVAAAVADVLLVRRVRAGRGTGVRQR